MTQSGARGGFPSKIYTSMACAKPVIASADPDSGLAKVIAAAGCGRMVNPGEPQALAGAVLQAFRERQKLPEEGARGRRFVEAGFSRRVIAPRYDALIRGLIGS